MKTLPRMVAGGRKKLKARIAVPPAMESVAHPSVDGGHPTMTIQNIQLAMMLGFIAVWAVAGQIAIHKHSGR